VKGPSCLHADQAAVHTRWTAGGHRTDYTGPRHQDHYHRCGAEGGDLWGRGRGQGEGVVGLWGGGERGDGFTGWGCGVGGEGVVCVWGGVLPTQVEATAPQVQGCEGMCLPLRTLVSVIAFGALLIAGMAKQW